MNKTTLVFLAITLVTAVGLGAIAYAQSEEIPKWVKEVAQFWVDGQISDSEFIEAIEFLVNAGIIKISESKEVSNSESKEFDSNPFTSAFERLYVCSYEDTSLIDTLTAVTTEFNQFNTLFKDTPFDSFKSRADFEHSDFYKYMERIEININATTFFNVHEFGSDEYGNWGDYEYCHTNGECVGRVYFEEWKADGKSEIDKRNEMSKLWNKISFIQKLCGTSSDEQVKELLNEALLEIKTLKQHYNNTYLEFGEFPSIVFLHGSDVIDLSSVK